LAVTNITITDQNCWICNGKEKITMHHTLPKHLNPQKNIIVPICHLCHDKINTVDLASITAYANKLLILMGTSKSHIKQLVKKLEELYKQQTK